MGIEKRRSLRTLSILLFVTCFGLLSCNRGEPQPKKSPTPAKQPASPSPSPSPSPTPDEPALAEVGSFNSPIHVAAAAGDPRLFVVEQAGRVVVVKDGKVLEQPFLDIRSKVASGGERGLFSMAFAPDYSSNGLFYVSYTDVNGDSNVVEYKATPPVSDRADSGSARRILFQDQPFPNHNGGFITFDLTGMLVFGLGDGGSGGDPGNRAQNLGTMLGKLVRVDPRHPSPGKPYSVPSDNPFVGRAGALPEIWAYGLRNPWRFSFDPDTKDLFLGDVGQNKFEEINWVPAAGQAGANYGWRAYEGSERFTDEKIDESRLVRPVHTYSLSGNPCAVVGGLVYRAEVNFLRNFYLYTDNCDGVIRGFKVSGGVATEHRVFEQMRFRFPSSFGQDSSGSVYVTDLAGKVYKIVKKV